MKKILIVIISLVVVLGAFYAFNGYIYTEKQGTGEIDRYRATLSGEYICLPHKDTSGPQTMECAFGLKTDAGEYYAVDFSLMSQMAPNVPMNTRITASGTVTPIEMLSTDMWNKYPIEGIFSVTDSLSTSTSATGIEGAEWVWVRTELPAGKTTAAPVGKFVLSLDGKGGMTSSTDCNRMGGQYVLDGEVISFGSIYSTKMYCEGSIEGTYAQELSLATSYVIAGNELRINLNRDAGIMVFKKKN